MSLTYIGTHHWDLEGERRLYRALGAKRPDVLVTEHFPAGSIQRERLNVESRAFIHAVVNHEVPRDYVASMANLFRGMFKSALYEGRVIQRYMSENPGSVLMAEDDHVFEIDIQQLLHEIGEEIGKVKTKERHQEAIVGEQYRLVRKSIIASGSVASTNFSKAVDLGLIGDRDRNISADVRRAVKEFPDKRISVIAGCFHFLHDPEGNTIYSQTLDLEPEVMMLDEF